MAIERKFQKQVWDEELQDYVIPDLKKKMDEVKPKAETNLQICYSCDRYNETTRMCKECGCFVDLKRLVFYLVDKQGCPLGKWS